MRDFDLKKLQEVELQMLKDVVHFCDENDITYFLDSGTLLGAVRHNGFIPWDDDIDICMDVINYKKFLNLVAKKGLSDKYFIQNYKTDPKCSISWSKIRMNGTTSMERDLTNYHIHYGVCMDIFVKVGRNESKIGKKIQNVLSRFQNELLVKHYYLAKHYSMSRRQIIFYKLLPEKLRIFILTVLEKILLVNTNSKKVCFNTWYLPNEAKLYESKMYADNNKTKLQFEDEYFWIPKDYVKYLEITYGDWQKLPPEDQRGGHGDIIIDFENDYSIYYTDD